MSKSMPFLGASIFLKGNWPSEGGFPIPSESRPGKGVCTKSGHSSERARLCGLDLQPATKKQGLPSPGKGSMERPTFPHLPQQPGQLPTPASDSPATSRKASPPDSSPSLGAGRRPALWPSSPLPTDSQFERI